MLETLTAAAVCFCMVPGSIPMTVIAARWVAVRLRARLGRAGAIA